MESEATENNSKLSPSLLSEGWLAFVHSSPLDVSAFHWQDSHCNVIMVSLYVIMRTSMEDFPSNVCVLDMKLGANVINTSS